MNTPLIILILLFLFTALFLVLYILVLVDQMMGHTLPTSTRATNEIVEIVKKYKPGATNFYDLGCARGRLSLAIKKQLPKLEVVALDCSRLRVFFAKVRAILFRQKIKFSATDIFKKDLSDADILYSYLWYDHLPPLEEKLLRELKTNSIVITNTSFFPNWKPAEIIVLNPDEEEFEKLFVYVKR